MTQLSSRLSGPRARDKALGALATLAICVAGGAAVVFALGLAGTDYAFLAAYTVLQFVALASAWNILGGYAGYVNFGVAGFFAVGVYTSVIVYKTLQWPLIFTIPLAAVLAGLLGLGMGYLTLRLRGVFFSIATLAFSIVLNTLIVNWSFVGGSRGVYVMHPASIDYFGSYARYLVIVMLILAIGCVLIARAVERSWIGSGLAALKDDEIAAECAGVPSLRLKLFATTLSGALLGAIGAPFPYFITYVDPASAFSLTIAVNTIAMPLIGGTATWLGPVIGAVLLGTLQQVATVTISSALNLLIVGILLVIFITVAPNGIVGFVKGLREKRR
jgi:branched-chain amino acid transport system permease protein